MIKRMRSMTPNPMWMTWRRVPPPRGSSFAVRVRASRIVDHLSKRTRGLQVVESELDSDDEDYSLHFFAFSLFIYFFYAECN